MIIDLPYGENGKIRAEIPSDNLLGIIEPREMPALSNIEKAVKDSLASPNGSTRLSEIIKHGYKVTIIVTDITRPCPDKQLLPPILAELRNAGIPEEQISLVIATGMHRPMTVQECVDKFGEQICETGRLTNHVSSDEGNLVGLGRTSNLQIPLSVNKVVAEADVVVSTGMVDTHIFAGYSGGGKSVMPGVSGLETIENMHRPVWLENQSVSICSVDRNPVRLDIDEAAKKAGLCFVVNVVLNGKEEVAHVSAGNPVTAHRECVKVADHIFRVPIPRIPDIVISVPRYPKDIDLYQATRAANNFVCGSCPAVKRGGVIIIPAPCQDGTGSDTFYEWMKEAKNLDEITMRCRKELRVGSHRPYIMAKIMKWVDVIIVGSRIPNTVEEMKMLPATTIEEALEIAFKRTSREAKILVSLHGLTTVPVCDANNRVAKTPEVDNKPAKIKV
jgi:nickel-dependent lactate racemase